MKKPSAHRSTDRRGFALIITVTLLALLVLLLVTLASLTKVETQVSTNSQMINKARQNALMALNLAIGQLQKNTGPDQRVTATADLQPVPIGSSSDPVSGQSLSAGTTSSTLDAVDAYWLSRRNRHWVGVWKDPDPDRTSLDPENPADSASTPELLSWLVSGNENTGTTYLPSTQIANLTLSTLTSSDAPTATFGTSAAPYRLLLGTGTTTITTAAEVDRAVVAPLITINSNSVPGLSGSQPIGHYAWWVGDEGLKVRANVIDPYATSATTAENLTRLQSAQRPGAIEAMTDLTNLYPANDAALDNVLAMKQLSNVNADSSFQTAVATRYHDITVQSRGVLADVRNGGLKADLSWMLGQSSDTVLQTELRNVYGNTSLLTTDSILSNSVTPYVSAPGANSFTGNFSLGLSRSATWSQLRTFYNMGNLPSAATPGVIDSNSKAVRRLQLQSQQGLSPMIVQAKVFFGLKLDASGAISLQIRPLVVLANPYDIPLTGDYWVKISRPVVYICAGDFSSTAVPSSPTLTEMPYIKGSTSNSSPTYSTRMNLVIRGSEIPAGEARVYSLSQSYADTGSGATQEINMTEGYDPSPIFTMATTFTLAGTTNTHAGLYVTSGNPEARIFAQAPTSLQDEGLLQYVYSYPLNVSGVGGNFFIVYPTASGETRSGGGAWFTVLDSLTTTPRQTQQANFLQYNPRTMLVFYTGSSVASGAHPFENAQSYQRNGAAGNDAYFTADLMFDNSSGDLVRWGPVTKADLSAPLSGNPPSGVGSDTGFVNILYSVPRESHPVSSIAQLQQFSPSGFIANNRFNSSTAEQFATLANSFTPNYPIGNSYPNPRIPRNRTYYNGQSNASGALNVGTVYDASWLYNEVLADRFYFSSYPASGSFDFATGQLTNQSLHPFRDPSDTAWDDPLSFRGAPRTAATNLMVDGAFNINSTSVEAWKALLSALRDVPVNSDTSVNVPFVRGLYQNHGYTNARTGNSAAAWAGFHNLSDTEIDSLAKELVLQIRRRGPFVSLADFINRRLVAQASDPLNNGLVGTLQAAIDAILNQQSDVDAVFRVQSLDNNFAETTFKTRTMTAGAPGYIMQADLLSPLAPILSARSDTFTIRTYGDVQEPTSGEVAARAWCEVIVQRTPDYVVPAASSGGNAPDELPTAGSDNDTFGRRYEIVSFRWLRPEEI